MAACVREHAVDDVVRQPVALGEMHERARVDVEPIESAASGADPEVAIGLLRVGKYRADSVVTQAGRHPRIVAIMPKRACLRIEPRKPLIGPDPQGA